MQKEICKLEAHALQSRLRGEAQTIPPETGSASKGIPPTLPQVTQASSSLENCLDSGDDSSLGLLDIFDELPDSEMTDEGTTRQIINLALPKLWSGRTPKQMLAETLSKMDKYSVINYQLVSGSSRAKRSTVQIRWRRSKVQEWTMEDVACHDQTQAEQYVATLALHDLIFPVTDGFAAKTPAASAGQTSFRLLPAGFRALWEELEIQRRDRDALINRSVWANLRSLVQEKTDLEMTVRLIVLNVASSKCSVG